MADIVNLRRARKAKRRTDQAAEADAARLRHGVNKADRMLASLEQARATHRLDAHRRDDEPDRSP